jgi:hypothetical protein
MSALDPDGEDPSQKSARLAARAARFNKSAPGKRNKEVGYIHSTLLMSSWKMLVQKNDRHSKLRD